MLTKINASLQFFQKGYVISWIFVQPVSLYNLCKREHYCVHSHPMIQTKPARFAAIFVYCVVRD